MASQQARPVEYDLKSRAVQYLHSLCQIFSCYSGFNRHLTRSLIRIVRPHKRRLPENEAMLGVVCPQIVGHVDESELVCIVNEKLLPRRLLVL